MEPTGNTMITPYSGHGHVAVHQSRRLLRVFMMLGDDIIMSLLDKKLYICLHKVAMIGKEAMESVLQILKETDGVSDRLICEVVATADDYNVVQYLIKQIQSIVNIPLQIVTPESSYARVLNGTSDAYLYTSIGHKQYAVEKIVVGVADDLQTGHIRSITSVVNGGDSVVISSRVKHEEQTTSTKNNNGDSQVDVGCSIQPRRKRMVWTQELRQAFSDAVQKLGIENAVPKKILEMMNLKWPGLTRENVASHLQKYRLSMINPKTEQNEISCRRRRKSIASNPDTSNTRATDPCDLPGPVIRDTPQLSIHNSDSSSSLNGAVSFDNNMHARAHLDYSYDMHDDMTDLIDRSFYWDLEVDIRNSLWY